jgi:hypothetical protein
MKPTENQKDLLFKLSDYFREKVICSDIDNPKQHIEIQRWVESLYDEGVLEQDDMIDMERSLITIFSLVRVAKLNHIRD